MSNNPFLVAYTQSDILGKLIFIALIMTSIVCWITLCYKFWMTWQSRKNSAKFETFFLKNKNQPLDGELESTFRKVKPNPFYELYMVLKKNTIEVLNKNHKFGEKGATYLSTSDIDYVQSYLISNIATQTVKLEQNLFLLSTIYGLAPLLGLLGTVWGILVTFGSQGIGSNQEMLGGLSLALTTTVLGLISAIPALIAFNYLRNSIRNFETEMEGFATIILSSVEMQYRIPG